MNAVPLLAGTVTLAWDSPSFNNNGTQLTDLGGYKIHYGEASGYYSNLINVGKSTTYHFNNLRDEVTYYFTVTAYDFDGNESDYANEVVRYGADVPTISPSGSRQEDVWTEDYALDTWSTTYNLSDPVMDYRESIAGNASISAMRTRPGCASLTIELPEKLSLNPLDGTIHFDVYTEDSNEQLSFIRFQTPFWSNRLRYLFSPKLSLHNGGWTMVELNLSEFVVEAGSPDWNTIGKVSFSFCGGSEGAIKIDNLYFTSFF